MALCLLDMTKANMPSIKCMHRQVPPRGGRVLKNCPILWTNSTDRLRECVTKGVRGLKILKFCVTSFMDGPLFVSKLVVKKNKISLREKGVCGRC